MLRTIRIIGGRRIGVLGLSVILLLSGVLAPWFGARWASGESSSGWRTAKENGVHWLCSPEGRLFYSKGVNVFNGAKESEKSRRGDAFFWRNHFKTIDQWRDSAEKNLVDWGFNTRGAWSDPSRELDLSLMVEIDLGRNARLHWSDPFDPAMKRKTLEKAMELTAPYRDDPNLVGYFTDNEVGWWNAPLFRWYLEAGWENHTKRVLWRLLFDHYQGEWERLLEDWVPQGKLQGFEDLKQADARLKLRPGGEGIPLIDRFTYLCARRYYSLVHQAIRQAHPRALILGDRLPLYYHQDAVLAMADQVDVVSTNYNVDCPDGWVAPYYFEGLEKLTGKPVLVTEFFFAAHENRSGNLNPGHLMTVSTQTERARGVGNALYNFARFPNVVGAHWFQYTDEPKGGRDDGENYNMGLVDIANRPYERLTETFRHLNPQLETVHRQSGRDGLRLCTSPVSDRAVIRQTLTEISVIDQSLTDWDKEATRLQGFQTEPPYVPFGDVHLSWAPEGLYLASLAGNYVDLGLLAYDEAFPLEETFQLHLLIQGDDGKLKHFGIHLMPEKSSRFRDRLEITPQLYRYEAMRPVEELKAEGYVQKLAKPLPHIAFEAFIPVEWIGREPLHAGSELRMNIVLVNYYRELSMSWSGEATLKSTEHPVDLRTVKLEGSRAESVIE